MEGLNDGLQYQLLSHTFANFQQLVDKALVIENKRRQMEEKRGSFKDINLGATLAFVPTLNKLNLSSAIKVRQVPTATSNPSVHNSSNSTRHQLSASSSPTMYR